jgi:spore coat polysaccharide biosynthesis protein SpsF
VATTTNPLDDPIANLCGQLGIPVYRGSEEDVLDRFYQCASALQAGVVVRLTADDPFKDPQVIDHAVGLLKTGHYDYCSNTLRPSFPEGIDVEVFTFEALARAHAAAALPSEREHVTPYIWKHPDLFKLHNFVHAQNLSGMRWTIDYESDLQFAREVYRRLYTAERVFLMDDILALLRREPDLGQINTGIMRNEGYHRSLAAEASV